jgi:hypothetical protein
MTNFVLIDLPNFIVVGRPRRCDQTRPDGEPSHLDANFAAVLELMGASADGPEPADKIVYNDLGDAMLRRVLDRFGFERRPDTFAELYGLLDYCDRMTAISGIGFAHPRDLPDWQARSFLLVSAQTDPHIEAARLFCLRDFGALRAWHRESDAMRRIGIAYQGVA